MRHGGAAEGAARAIDARVRWSGSGTLQIDYELRGDLPKLRIPPPRPARRADRLWQHTCFELFVAQPGMPAYREFNFSPSGEWAAYAFSGYRVPAPAPDEMAAPRIVVTGGPETILLEATVALPEGFGDQRALALGITAVVEDAGGDLSYWALSHPDAKPDFHRAESFTLVIDAVRH